MNYYVMWLGMLKQGTGFTTNQQKCRDMSDYEKQWCVEHAADIFKKINEKRIYEFRTPIPRQPKPSDQQKQRESDFILWSQLLSLKQILAERCAHPELICQIEKKIMKLQSTMDVSLKYYPEPSVDLSMVQFHSY